MKSLKYLIMILVIYSTITSSSIASIGDPPGGGTSGNPYRIENMFHFVTFKNPANAATYWASGVYTRLDCDIDLDPAGLFGAVYDTAVIAPDTDNSTPGFQGTPFSGHFDGNGHTIKNVIIDTQGTVHEYLGFFGMVIDGSVKNLSVIDLNFNCDSSWYIGGISAYNDGGLIQKCHATGWITGSTAPNSVGGICGFNIRGIIEKSIARVNIKAGSSSSYLGGMCGFNNNGTLRKSYATGSVEGHDYVGGFCGFFNETANIERCYSVGRVTGINRKGGFAGYSLPPGTEIITDCFWDVETSGIGSDGDNWGGSIGKTTVKMKDPDTFNALWDYTTPVWYQPPFGYYPQLQGLPQTGLFGYGSAAVPFYIFNFDDFNEFRNPQNAYMYWDENVHVKLDTDLDLDPALPGRKTYTTAPIAPDTDNTNNTFEGIPYNGWFNGNDHTIKNLTIDTQGTGNDFLGLFGRIGDGHLGAEKEVKSLGLENLSITGSDNSWYVGGLCSDANYHLSIKNCYVTGQITGELVVGGLCGYLKSSVVSDCYSTANITGAQKIGGLLGSVFGGSFSVGSNSLIENSYATGSITVNGVGNNRIGGFCGRNAGNSSPNSSTIQNCYSTGSIAGTLASSDVGGFCGENVTDGLLENCYSTGHITGVAERNDIGGFCGSDGLVHVGTITHSFWDVNASRLGADGDDNLGATGKSRAKMKQATTFTDAGWDYVTTPIWHQPFNKYPQLVGLPETGRSGTGIVPILNLLMD